MAAMLSSSTEEISMTDVLLNMNAASIGGTIIPGGQEARKVVGATGVVTVKGIDAPSYLQAGAKLLNARVFNQALPVAPRASWLSILAPQPSRTATLRFVTLVMMESTPPTTSLPLRPYRRSEA
jgi:hypothetical protein